MAPIARGAGAVAAVARLLELTVVLNEADVRRYAPSSTAGTGYVHSGSSAGRNVERLYAVAASAAPPAPCVLHTAVDACMARATHVLVVTGFFVAHAHASERVWLH